MKQVKKALLECKTAVTLNQDYISKAEPVAIAIWRGNIVAVEWQMPDGGILFWDDENIVSISTIIDIKTK